MMCLTELKGFRMSQVENVSRVTRYVISYARDAGLCAASFEEGGGSVVVLSIPGRIGPARLYIELESAILELGEYQYVERFDVDPMCLDGEEDVELYEILVIAAKKWLNGQYEEVELRGCFGRSGVGIRVDFEDGDYIELPKGSGRLLSVKHKWFWGDPVNGYLLEV